MVGIASGSVPTTFAPAASSPSAITIAGASRTSSVRGLNASPHNANVRPVRSAPKRAFTRWTRSCFCSSLTASTAVAMRMGTPTLRPTWMKPCVSLGKQEPP